VLTPNSFDLLTRNETKFMALTKQFVPKEFTTKALVSELLDNNTQVYFAHYIMPPIEIMPATVIDIHHNEHGL
jgi:hypothetical protein